MTRDIYSEYRDRAATLFNGSSVKVYPFIGNKYFLAPIKVLVLGESQYGARELGEGNFIDIHLNSYLCNDGTNKFESFFEYIKYVGNKGYCECFRKTATMIAGEKHACADYIWEYLAYSNYFQSGVAESYQSHSWLTEQDKVEARKALFEGLLPKLAPQIVMVWGHMQNALPAPDGMLKNDELKKLGCFCYKNFPDTVFVPFTHPSAIGKNGWKQRPANQRWNVLAEIIPELRELRRHHPAAPKVYPLYCQVKKLTGAVGFFSDCSFTFSRFVTPDNSKQLRIETIFLEDGSAKIKAYACEIIKNSKGANVTKYVENDTIQEFLTSKKIRFTPDEFLGRVVLQEIPANAPLNEILNSVIKIWKSLD